MHDQVAGRKERRFPFYYRCVSYCFSLHSKFEIVHQRPLSIWSLSTKPLTQKRPYAQLPSRMSTRRGIPPSFFNSFLLKYHVPPTWLCCSVSQP